MNQTIIVIGLSAASVAFITKLRTFDAYSKIIVFTQEKDFAYNRCLLADLLAGEIDLPKILLKPLDFFEQNNIKIYFNTKITKIDDQKKLVFSDQNSYQYDYVFLGIGTRPFIPAFAQNFAGQGLFTFHTLDDIEKIDTFIRQQKPKSAVVIGAGFNGLEAAWALKERNICTAVVELQDSILPQQIDIQSAAWIEKKIQAHGIMIIKHHKVIDICVYNGFVKSVKLETNAQIACDLVIIATGSKLNNEILADTQIQLQNGSILVNQHMQTSVSSIFAAGDICAVTDIKSNNLVRSCTWSEAMLQGLCAATTLSSTSRAYQGYTGLRDSYFFGKHFYACGQTVVNSADVIKIIDKDTDQDLQVLFKKNDQLIGFILIGDISRLSELKRAYLT